MSGFVVAVNGRRARALVVGGGAVATRRVRSLVRALVPVRVVALEVCAALARLAEEVPPDQLTMERRRYASADVGDAELVFAATDDRAVNARVAADARALHRLVNVADLPADGNFTVPAQGGRSPLLFSVSAGGLPDGATRMLAAIEQRFDERYAIAVTSLSALRARLLGDGRSDRWAEARAELLGEDFCASVEDGEIVHRIDRWR